MGTHSLASFVSSNFGDLKGDKKNWVKHVRESREFLVAQFSVHIQLALPSQTSNKLSTLPSFTSCDPFSHDQHSPWAAAMGECLCLCLQAHLLCSSHCLWFLLNSLEVWSSTAPAQKHQWKEVVFHRAPPTGGFVAQFKPRKRWQRPDLGRSDTPT